MVAGVCAGLARATGTDPILFRVILTVLVFFGGVGALLYVVAWVLLPLDDEPASPVEALLGRGRSATAPALTLGLIILAALLLAGTVSNGFESTVLLVACLVGGALLLRRSAGLAGPGTPTPPPTPDAAAGFTAGGPSGFAAGGPSAPSDAPWPAAPSAPTGAAMPTSGFTAAAAGDAAASTATAPPAPGVGSPPPPYPPPAAGYSTPYTQPFAPNGPYGSFAPNPPAPSFPPAPPGRRRRKKERSVLGRLTFSLACLALVVLAIVDGAGLSIPFTGYVALALTVVTLGVFAGIWVGRARWLIVLGVLLTMMLGLGSVATDVDRSPSRYGVDDQVRTPLTAAEILPSYHSGAGDFDLDLTAVDFTGVTRTVQIDSGIGDVRVRLPANVDATVEWDIGVGDVSVFGRHQSGLGQNGSVTNYGVDGPDTSDLRLEIHHGAGDLEVSR